MQTGPDPIAVSYNLWIAQGWDEAAVGLAAVTSIFRAQQLLLRQADQILAPFDLSFSRFEVLSVIAFNGGEQPLARIGEHIQVHQASVTGLVDKLERQGLISRVPHPTDRRVTVARITAKGKTVARKAHQAMNAHLFANLQMDERGLKQIIFLLANMRHGWGDLVDDPAWEKFEREAGLASQLSLDGMPESVAAPEG